MVEEGYMDVVEDAKRIAREKGVDPVLVEQACRVAFLYDLGEPPDEQEQRSVAALIDTLTLGKVSLEVSGGPQGTFQAPMPPAAQGILMGMAVIYASLRGIDVDKARHLKWPEGDSV